MVDISAIKARLSDPREVARLLGLRIEQKTRNGVLCRCPVHGNKSGSLWLRYDGGKLKMQCFGCGIYGDAIDLLVAIEGDFKAGLARAEQIAGGSSGRAYVPEPEAPRLDPVVYHTLSLMVLEAGKLDGRAWVREVEGYLERRRLLELARADGWACLPGFGALQRFADRDTLIAADLARYNQRGEFVPTWGRWRLVIPWRGPDGRITSLQRRRTWEHDGDGPEPAKYVFPRGIRPEWPYGSERIGGYDQGRVSSSIANDSSREVAKCGLLDGSGIQNDHGRGQAILRANGSGMVGGISNSLAIVEGAVDVLAMRALHPSFAALGLPGIGGWRADWAKLVCRGTENLEGSLRSNDPSRSSFGNLDGVTVQRCNNLRICLDRGKPDPHGVIPEDRASARIALDVAQAAWQREGAASGRWGSEYHGNDPWQRVNDCGQGSVTATGGRGKEALGQPGASVFPYTDLVLEWLTSRHRRGRALFCVLCGREEAWLCRGCGRRRAPEGMDWGKLWERQATP